MMHDDTNHANTATRPGFIRLLLVLCFVLAGAFAWIKLSPPQVGPELDCRTGISTNNMEARIRLLSSCLTYDDITNEHRAIVHYKRGNAYAATGVFGLAIKDYDAAIHLKYDFADARYNRANTYENLKKYDLALKDYDVAIHLNPRDGQALHNRANILLWQGHRVQALKDLDEAIRINPDHFTARFTRSNAHAKNGDYKRAVEDLNHAIRMKPDNPLYHLYRSRVHAILADLENAIRDANTAIRLSESPGAAPYAADIRKYYDGHTLLMDSNVFEIAEFQRPQINWMSKLALATSYGIKLKTAESAEIERVQQFLSEAGYYMEEIDGRFRPVIVKGLGSCITSLTCEIGIDPVTGLE